MADTAHVLVVDPDPLLQELIAAGMRLFSGEIRVLTADNPESALLVLGRQAVTLVVTELEFEGPGLDGAAFLRELEEFSPQLPVVILTEAAAEDFQNLVKAEAFIAKPPDMDHLLGRIHQIVRRNRESVLRGISLESFLQVLEVERKTCTLTVTSGHRVGRLYIHGGELIHAETDRFESKAAAFAMLGWPDYTIKIIERCDAEPTIAERLNSILMEYCVEKDHAALDGAEPLGIDEGGIPETPDGAATAATPPNRAGGGLTH